MMKRLVLISATLITLTGCADRERLNCPPIKNKALSSVTDTVTPEPTTAPRYATSGKC